MNADGARRLCITPGAEEIYTPDIRQCRLVSQRLIKKIPLAFLIPAAKIPRDQPK
jgi:hypothetical protein